MAKTNEEYDLFELEEELNAKANKKKYKRKMDPVSKVILFISLE